jgi:hypothetical protein
MQSYNKIMLYFWLVVGILILVGVTYMSLSEENGFAKWRYYYLFSGLAFFMFIVRRWMIKRMERHIEWMEKQEKEEK